VRIELNVPEPVAESRMWVKHQPVLCGEVELRRADKLVDARLGALVEEESNLWKRCRDARTPRTESESLFQLNEAGLESFRQSESIFSRFCRTFARGL
jgi:hypothetical protein